MVVSVIEGDIGKGTTSPDSLGVGHLILAKDNKVQGSGSATAGSTEQQVTFGPWIMVNRKRKTKEVESKAGRGNLATRDNLAKGKASSRMDDDRMHDK